MRGLTALDLGDRFRIILPFPSQVQALALQRSYPNRIWKDRAK